MSLAQYTRQLNDGLHALDLPLDDDVEVLLLDLGEHKEVDGPGVAGLGILRDERPQALVDVLRQEGCIRGLQQTLATCCAEAKSDVPWYGRA